MMATLATIALSVSAIQANAPIAATLTLTNNGAADVHVVSIQPLVTPAGLTRASVAAPASLPSTAGLNVPASGTATVSWTVLFLAPNIAYINASPAQLEYGIGALAYLSDGTVAAATPVLLPVGDPFHTPVVD